MRKARSEPAANDYIRLRGGIEVCLRNALTGEDIIRAKGENTVLYIGRNMVMTRSLATATQNPIQPFIVIGTGSANSAGTTAATQTGPAAYFTFKTGGINQTTQSGGTNVPYYVFTGSWESTELTVNSFGSIREFLMAFNTASTQGSTNATYLCRYVSASDISATSTNQLLVTYTVSW